MLLRMYNVVTCNLFILCVEGLLLLLGHSHNGLTVLAALHPEGQSGGPSPPGVRGID